MRAMRVERLRHNDAAMNSLAATSAKAAVDGARIWTNKQWSFLGRDNGENLDKITLHKT